MKNTKDFTDDWAEYRKEAKKKPTNRIEKVREFYKVENREQEDDRKKYSR